MPKVAIASLCIGERYRTLWRDHCAKGWQDYARRHGYALEVFERPLDPSPAAARRSPAWQKCLIPSEPALRGYDRVVWIDSDIAINRQAPPIAERVPAGKIGAVISGDYLQPEMKPIFLARGRGRTLADVDTPDAWAQDQRALYAAAGLPAAAEIVQTGVLVLEPGHAALLRAVYDEGFPRELKGAEQLPLSRAILEGGLLHRLDPRFNTVLVDRIAVHYPYLLSKDLPHYGYVAHLAVRTEMENAYFLHFAHMQEFVKYLAPG